MRNKKIIRLVVMSLLVVFFIVSFSLSQIIATDYFKNMFWASLSFLMVGTLLDLNAWSKIGLDVDKNKSRTIKRSFDDSTTILAVFYGTLLAIIVLLDSSKNNLMNNNYSIIIMFIMTLEFELFMYLSIWNAKKDTAKLLKENK